MSLLNLQAVADKPHPNRRTFSGVLTTVDKPSDKSPKGADGRRVILTHTAAKAALSGLVGQAIDFKANWDGHDARQKCGIITHAELKGKEVHVSGFIYKKDFPDVIDKLETGAEMGMSYELANCHVADIGAKVWTLTRVNFTGAAILLRNLAAYKSTSFRLTTA